MNYDTTKGFLDYSILWARLVSFQIVKTSHANSDKATLFWSSAIGINKDKLRNIYESDVKMRNLV